MASNFHIQKPYVLATLPTPLHRPDQPGKWSVGGVFGQRPGLRKRKRLSELAVGIDGDAVNLYDVPSSHLITSYPVPPQYVFTCPPCSVRWKGSSKEITRYTYACTDGAQASKRRATLFKDVVGKAGVKTSNSIFVALRLDSPVVYMTTIQVSASAPKSDSMSSELEQPDFNLLVVAGNGTILCLDRETLGEKWRASASAYLAGASGMAHGGCRVETAQTVLATAVIEGFFGGKSDILGGIFRRQVANDGFDPDVLVLICSPTDKTSFDNQRELVILAIPDGSPAQVQGSPRGHIFQVSSAILSTPTDDPMDPISYQLDVASGSLQELRNNKIYTYRVEDGVPRLSYTLPVPDASSFIRLSDSSVLVAAPTSLSIYNPAYRSVQASTALDLGTDATHAGKVDGPAAVYQLITYLPRLEIALGICGSILFAAQLEAPKTRKRKRRAEGLLVDSIGRGLSRATAGQQWALPDKLPEAFTGYVPGSLSEDYWKAWVEDTAEADEFLQGKDVEGFDGLIADKLGVQLDSAKIPNGTSSVSAPDASDGMDLDVTESEGPLGTGGKPQVDRRWLLFAISRVFALTTHHGEGLANTSLSCQLPESNMAEYLVSAGHLSVSNVKSAFNSEARVIHDVEAILAEQIPELISRMDPTLELLVEYLSITKLGAIELLAGIRLIMRSLDLVQDPTKLSQRLIGFGESENPREGIDEEEALAMRLDKLEKDLEVTEYHLLDDSSTRARGLTIALDLLGTCTPTTTVQALRRLFRPEEILSLIHVLRVELVKGGWTARYLDASQLEGEDEQEPPQDGSIRLIADLLCRCIDSVGPGGWMINDALLARTGDHLDSADFLAGLRLEVSAALEGIQEAVYLRGLLTETVKYGYNVQKALPDAQPRTSHKGRQHGRVRNKPQTLSGSALESQMLPLGLGAKQRVSATKVNRGGEIITRSRREIGHLMSQRVGAYSLERIVV